MNRLAMSLVGGLLGFVSSLALMQPIAAFLGPTAITWNASNCAAGIYTITSFVRGEDGIVAHSVTTKNVSLPKASVTQQFPSLPARAWQASAITTGEGRAYRSSTQSIQGQGSDDGRFGRSRPAAAPAVGLARPRPPTPTTPPTEPRSTPPVSSIAQPPAADAAPKPGLAMAAPRPQAHLTVEQVLRRFLVQLNAGLDPDAPEAAGLPWRYLVIEDINGDGVADVVTIELADGGMIAIRLHVNSNLTVARLP